MSRLHNQYKKLKLQDENKLYLFKSGIFYIFLERDAELISAKYHLKCTNLNENVIKCGFPVGSYSKYKKLFDEDNLNVIKIEDLDDVISSNVFQEFIVKIKELDLLNTTPIEVYQMVLELKENLK